MKKNFPGRRLLIILILSLILSGCSVSIPQKSSESPERTSAAASAQDPAASTRDPSADPVPSSPSASESTAPEDQNGFRLGGQPVKTLYVEGEYFDPTGLYIIDGSSQPAALITDGLQAPPETLTAGMTEVSLSWGNCRFSCPVTVLPGDGTASFVSRVSDAQEQKAVSNFVNRSGAEILPNRDGEAFAVQQALPNPCPDGHVTSRQELADYVDYHVFYGITSVTVWLDYEYTDPEEELNDLYWRSRLIAGTAALQLHDPGSGPLQILLRYYRDQLFRAEKEGLKGVVVTPFRKTSSRSGYTSSRIREDGITVFTSDQAVYALMAGFDISPVPGSPAETILLRAQELLCTYGDDSWSDLERLYHILLCLLDHADYDHPGDNAAGEVPDPALEPDLFVARLVSFRAEGPLLYGASACYGFAKAAALLLSLEGYELTRVLTRENGMEGRSICQKAFTGYDSVIRTHSYLYVRMGGEDLLFDATYSFAGSVSYGSVSADWFRDPCLCLSCAEHREVYTSLEPDWYSQSAQYRPGNGARLKELCLDNGSAGLLLQSKSEWDACLKALGQELSVLHGTYPAATLVVRKDVFGSRSGVREAAYSFCAGYSGNYYAYVDEHSYGGEDYYVILLSMQRE